MVAASAAEVAPQFGGAIEVWTIQSERDLVYASGPRLQLWGGMQIWWRFLDEQGMPHRAELEILESRYKSDTRASLMLKVVAVEADRATRLHERWAVTGAASLTAVHCRRIVDTDRLRATFRDLSLSGVALLVDDVRVQPGDRFLMRSRFIEGAIDTEVRVARVQQHPGSRAVLVGAFFLHPTAQLGATVERVIARFGSYRHTAAGSGIRESLGDSEDPATSRRVQERSVNLGFIPRVDMA
jgi:PilZ domain